jgi:hypothetical protein
MPEMTPAELSRFFREGPVDPLRIQGIVETEDSRYLGAVGLHLTQPQFHGILGFNWSGILSDDARFYTVSTSEGLVAIFRQFDSSKYQSFPEDLLSGWVPHAEAAKLEAWVADMNRQLQDLLKIKHSQR